MGIDHKRNHNKVLNSVVRKIIKHTCIHVSGRSVKKEYSLLGKWIFAVVQDL